MVRCSVFITEGAPPCASPGSQQVLEGPLRNQSDWLLKPPRLLQLNSLHRVSRMLEEACWKRVTKVGQVPRALCPALVKINLGVAPSHTPHADSGHQELSPAPVGKMGTTVLTICSSELDLLRRQPLCSWRPRCTSPIAILTFHDGSSSGRHVHEGRSCGGRRPTVGQISSRLCGNGVRNRIHVHHMFCSFFLLLVFFFCIGK